MPSLAPDGLPVPPVDLIVRAGSTPGGDAVAQYLAGAAGMKEHLMALRQAHGPALDRAPRVLDFGCGAGNVIRHFKEEAEAGEVWGVDIDARSIEWLTTHLSPPFRFAALDPEPYLPLPDGHFDLAYAISVFTHLADDWASWVLELHRVLAPGGILMATILGEGMAEAERAAPWDEDRTGMNVLRHGQDWEGGGPTVFISDWWLRAHWGRAFEIVDIVHERNADGAVRPGTHARVVARRREVVLTPEQLVAHEPGEPRELAALERNIEQLHADDRELRGLLSEARRRGDIEHGRRVAAETELAALRASLERSRVLRLWRSARRALGR
jgi:SAM-dependent methyltransferase